MARPEPLERDDASRAAAADELRDRFVLLAERELDRSYRLAGLILGSGAEAEDAVGDALERAWREAHRLRDMSRFQAWFDRILVNACRDRLRRRRTVTFVPIEGERTVVADPFRLVDDEDEAVRSLATLPPDERMIVILHFWADLTLEVAADRLGWPIGTVKSRLHRALERLRSSGIAAPEREGLA